MNMRLCGFAALDPGSPAMAGVGFFAGYGRGPCDVRRKRYGGQAEGVPVRLVMAAVVVAG